MNSFSLLAAFVPHSKAEKISDAAIKAGSFGGTVFTGRHISENSIAALFGVGEWTQDIVLILTIKNDTKKIKDSIIQAVANEKKNFGEILELNADSMIKKGEISQGGNFMKNDFEKELITVIVNKGYADDVMAEARKAGAKGGTVINARGTAKEDDAKFFGMHIVPEKEMLMIVVESEKKSQILEAIKNLDCLKHAGVGIAFCTPVEAFDTLGKN